MDFYTNVRLFKGQLYIRGYLDGDRYQQKEICKPYLFTTSQDKNSKYQTVDGQPVSRVDFETVTAARDFLKTFEDVEGFSVYGMARKYEYPWINDNYEGQIKFDPQIIVKASLDIEVDSSTSDDGEDLFVFPNPEIAKWNITAITIGVKGRYHIFAYSGFDVSKTKNNEDFEVSIDKIDLVTCENEQILLREFLTFWEEIDPDIVTGWNIDGFDIPYLYNRIKNIGSEEVAKRLSPWKMVHTREVNIFGKKKILYTLVGLPSIDYLPLYKKFRFKIQESYKLGHIAFVELKQKKLDYSSKYKNLFELYKKDYQLYCEYNIIDVFLIDKLEEKLNFLDQVLTIAYDAKINYDDVFGTIQPWDIIIHNFLINKNIVVPEDKPGYIDHQIAGGYVKNPIKGSYGWTVSFDLTSLYPSIMRQYNLSPEKQRDDVYDVMVEDVLKQKVSKTTLEYIKENKLTFTCNGKTWSKEGQGFMPAIIKKMFDERVAYKKKMLEAKKEYEKVEVEMRKRGIS